MISTVAYRSFFTLANLQKEETSCRRAAGYIRPRPSDFKALTAVFLCCVRLPRWGRSCARWSRMMEPGNRGWPSSWSRWWPWWLWRAEDRTSQGALGRDPIRNRAVPERRPVPMFFPSCDFHPPPFRDDFFLGLFSASSCPKICWVFPSTLLHKLVYLKKIWRVVLDWGRSPPQCNVGDSSSLPQGALRGVNASKVAILAYFGPPAGRRERKSILCCLQEFTLIGESLKTTMLAVHFVENFFSRLE